MNKKAKKPPHVDPVPDAINRLTCELQRVGDLLEVLVGKAVRDTFYGSNGATYTSTEFVHDALQDDGKTETAPLRDIEE